MASDCRFYEKLLPDVDDLVMVQVKRVAEMGAYVSLLEYNNQEGMILLSELSKRRIRSIAKLVRVGRFEVCSVLRVDHEKGYIDLSKRKVSAGEVTKCEQQFSQAKQVHSIMRQMATQHNEWNLIEWCSKVSWPLDQKYKSTYLAFKKYINDEEDIFAHLDLPENLKEAVSQVVKKRMMLTAVKLRAKIEVSCFEYEGIDAVKAALMEGFKADSVECPIQIRLIAPPQYAVVTTIMDKDQGTAKIDEAIEHIKKAILARGGQFVLKSKTEIVGDLDDEKVDTTKDSDEDGEASSEESESEQDETMGAANFNEEELLAKTKDLVEAEGGEE